DLFDASRNQNIYFRAHGLSPELPFPNGHSLARPLNVFPSSEGERSRRTDGRAHGALADTGAVITHVTLHHLVDFSFVFGDSKRTGQNAVGAADAARLE